MDWYKNRAPVVGFMLGFVMLEYVEYAWGCGSIIEYSEKVSCIMVIEVDFSCVVYALFWVSFSFVIMFMNCIEASL